MQMHHLADRHSEPAMPIGTTTRPRMRHLGLLALVHVLAELILVIVLVQWLREFEQGQVTSAPSDATDAQPRSCCFGP
jgi:hypothetical protein